jgi:hypothetical protein
MVRKNEGEYPFGMNSSEPKQSVDIQPLSGAIVLVKSSRDHRNPPTSMRGTVEVYQEIHGNEAEVKIALNYPQMFNSSAHHRAITLTPAQVIELVHSKRDGVYQISLDVDLAPEQ